MANKRTLKRVAKVLVVDDHPMMREGLVAQISDQPDLEVCGVADDVQDAMALATTCPPDLAIVDLSLKTGHGIDLTKDLKTRFPRVKVLILSAYQESLYAERSLRAGAMGYLNKQESCEKILEAIRTVLAGDRYVSAELAQRLIGKAIGSDDTTGSSPGDLLSHRELQVFRLIGEGLTTQEIAERLCLSPHTIETHREKIKVKLRLKNAAELHREATQWMLENV